MTKWDFLFYNFIALVDAAVLYAMVAALIESVGKTMARGLGASLALTIEKYYQYKKEFIISLTKEDKNFLEKTGQNSSGSNFN